VCFRRILRRFPIVLDASSLLLPPCRGGVPCQRPMCPCNSRAARQLVLTRLKFLVCAGRNFPRARVPFRRRSLWGGSWEEKLAPVDDTSISTGGNERRKLGPTALVSSYNGPLAGRKRKTLPDPLEGENAAALPEGGPGEPGNGAGEPTHDGYTVLPVSGWVVVESLVVFVAFCSSPASAEIGGSQGAYTRPGRPSRLPLRWGGRSFASFSGDGLKNKASTSSFPQGSTWRRATCLVTDEGDEPCRGLTWSSPQYPGRSQARKRAIETNDVDPSRGFSRTAASFAGHDLDDHTGQVLCVCGVCVCTSHCTVIRYGWMCGCVVHPDIEAKAVGPLGESRRPPPLDLG